MIFEYDLPWVFNPSSSKVENAKVLRANLEYLVRLNRIFLDYHEVPGLYQSGVVYGRTRVWDTIPRLYRKGYGDCKSLTAALIAERRRQGLVCQPVFRWIRNQRTGALDFHILVQTPAGFEDPSKRLGMNDENSYFSR